MLGRGRPHAGREGRPDQLAGPVGRPGQTGGLADTIIDANAAAVSAGAATGFKIYDISVAGLAAALDRVFDIYQQPKTWAAMQRAAMKQSVGWENSASAYSDIYRALAA